MSEEGLKSVESILIIGLHRIVTEMDKETKRICKSNHISSGQFMVLEALDKKGKMCIGEVKEYALSSDGTIPVITGNLEKMGYITKVQDASDKRKFMLEITEKGIEAVRSIYPKNNQMLRQKMNRWTEEEKRIMAKLIQKYLHAH